MTSVVARSRVAARSAERDVRVAGAGQVLAIAERIDARFRLAQRLRDLRPLDLSPVTCRGRIGELATEHVDGLGDDDG